MKECTTIEYPFALYNPEKEKDEIGYVNTGLEITKKNHFGGVIFEDSFRL